MCRGKRYQQRFATIRCPSVPNARIGSQNTARNIMTTKYLGVLVSRNDFLFGMVSVVNLHFCPGINDLSGLIFTYKRCTVLLY